MRTLQSAKHTAPTHSYYGVGTRYPRYSLAGTFELPLLRCQESNLFQDDLKSYITSPIRTGERKVTHFVDQLQSFLLMNSMSPIVLRERPRVLTVDHQSTGAPCTRTNVMLAGVPQYEYIQSAHACRAALRCAAKPGAKRSVFSAQCFMINNAAKKDGPTFSIVRKAKEHTD